MVGEPTEKNQKCILLFCQQGPLKVVAKRLKLTQRDVRMHTCVLFILCVPIYLTDSAEFPHYLCVHREHAFFSAVWPTGTFEAALISL